MVRRTSLIISEILAGLIAGMIALGGLAAWRLHSGPVPLDFLTPHLEAALRDRDAGFNIDIENTDLVWAGWRHAIDIRAIWAALPEVFRPNSKWFMNVSVENQIRALGSAVR